MPDRSSEGTSPPAYQWFWQQRDEGRGHRSVDRPEQFWELEIGRGDPKDLEILLVSELDGKLDEGKQKEIIRWCKLLDSASTEFQSERRRSVTHSFRSLVDKDGAEIIWMHFLLTIPNPTAANKQPSWVKSSFVLRWDPGPSANPTVKLVVFQPTVILRTQLLVSLFKSAEWAEALDDPYKLVDLVLLSWYERTDEIAFEVKNQVRKDEADIFGLAQSNVGSHDLHLLHTNAKSTTFMVEAVDAAIRATEMALASHENRRGHRNRGQGRKALWRKVHESLRYRQELFHSTRLTMLSTQSRVQNAISLAFHLGAAHGNRSMRTIAVVGLAFLPFTAITSIFGTQFFNYVDTTMPTDSESPSSRSGRLAYSSDFWILWATAIPFTAIFLGSWFISQNWTGAKPRLAGLRGSVWWITVNHFFRSSLPRLLHSAVSVGRRKTARDDTELQVRGAG